MCGIIGYVGKREALPLLLDGLKRLEYRGYDSAGVCLLNPKAQVVKTKGGVDDLRRKLQGRNLQGKTALGHNRWAVYGEPSEVNAHPHWDCQKKIFVVHNGIIENYNFLKEKLIERGHKFISETDTEVIAHLIEEVLKQKKVPLELAVQKTLRWLKGTYGLAVVSEDEPQKIVVARNSSPVLLGLGEGENFVASDAAALVAQTKKIIYLEDREMAVLTPEDYQIFDRENNLLTKETKFIDWDLAEAQKGGYPHFMLKEIFEQPQALMNSLQGRLVIEEGLAKLGGLEEGADLLAQIKKLVIVACGTSYFAGLVGKYMIEEAASLPVEVVYGSEFRYHPPVIDKETAVLAISQSGETADTLAGLREAKRKGGLTLGIINVVGSTIAREVEAGLYNHIGPEIGVASTKAFTSQLLILALLALFLGRQRGLSLLEGQRLAKGIQALPSLAEETLKEAKKIQEIAEKYKRAENALYLGRKFNYPIALEGALKLKEVSYLHAEGYPAGEMKHGPIALIDKNFPTVAICLKDSVYPKMLSNLEEIKSRKGPIIVLASQGDEEIKKLTEEVIFLPPVQEILSPILAVIPLQLLAYYLGVARGYNVDRPRNLAKSVVVE
jgi:glutamine---fructose-6-phosphate transaminase (isomerizing)